MRPRLRHNLASGRARAARRARGRAARRANAASSQRIAALVAASPRVGAAANCAASASTVAGNSASSTHRQIIPQAAACSAESFSPSSVRPSARALPTSRGRLQVPPESGTNPSRQNACTKLAERAAIDQIAGERDVRAGAGRDAVDRRDHRHRQLLQGQARAACSSARSTRRDRRLACPAPRPGPRDPGRRKIRGRRRSAPAPARPVRARSARHAALPRACAR